MKTKIAILGSTGSIGKSTLDIIRKDKKNFDVILLTANNNYKKLIQQAKQFKAKNVLIKNHKFYLKVKNSLKKTKVYSGDIQSHGLQILFCSRYRLRPLYNSSFLPCLY